jgi:hypothetical protein
MAQPKERSIRLHVASDLQGERGFQRYVGWSVITKNLFSMARWLERRKRLVLRMLLWRSLGNDSLNTIVQARRRCLEEPQPDP